MGYKMMGDLHRYIEEQERFGQFNLALQEIQNGNKLSHWMWFVFPQVKGLGRSYNAQKFAVRSKEEAMAYYSHPILGERLKLVTQAILAHNDKEIISILNAQIDVLKLKSCMTLFESVTHDAMFTEVLDVFYNGKKCEKTLRLLDFTV